ncbi:MAG: hypothetical protein JSR14_07825 [Proteobacteria bacterium]|nr:hypothetical protein [Pseudomonadota bacterium]
MSEATTEREGVTLTHARMIVCLEAAWEIDALARALPCMVERVDTADGQAHFLARGVAGRLLRLTSVLMSGLGESDVPTHKLESIINLESGQG